MYFVFDTFLYLPYHAIFIWISNILTCNNSRSYLFNNYSSFPPSFARDVLPNTYITIVYKKIEDVL